MWYGTTNLTQSKVWVSETVILNHGVVRLTLSFWNYVLLLYSDFYNQYIDAKSLWFLTPKSDVSLEASVLGVVCLVLSAIRLSVLLCVSLRLLLRMKRKQDKRREREWQAQSDTVEWLVFLERFGRGSDGDMISLTQSDPKSPWDIAGEELEPVKKANLSNHDNGQKTETKHETNHLPQCSHECACLGQQRHF